MYGTLYVVATPIGNLEDVTLRAIETLSVVDIILAEDTRVTKRLLNFISNYNIQQTTNDIQHRTYNISEACRSAVEHRTKKKGHKQNETDNSLDKFLSTSYCLPVTKLLSYHQHSSEKRKLEILRYLLEGKKVALVTDAGTPGISDPGNELIDFLLKKEPKINIVPIPGTSAIASALSISGFKTSKFMFLGYFPRKKKKKLIESIKSAKLPVVFFESPYRILKTLKYLQNELGKEIRVLVARELTKMHESLYRGKIDEVIKKLNKDVIKGEIVIVIEL